MVCTGNICRSPMMERIMQDAIGRRGVGGDVVVTSAGTWARPGEPMQPFAAAMLNQLGVNAANFGATSLTEGLVRSSDLVITATRAHRSHVVGLVPGAVRRTFTLLELARIASTAPVPTSAPASSESAGFAARVRQAVAWAAQMRGSVSRREESVDDLDDPLGAPLDIYRQRADAISEAVEQIVPFLIGGQSATTSG
jgi:protein-tyrosine phosphatase